MVLLKCSSCLEAAFEWPSKPGGKNWEEGIFVKNPQFYLGGKKIFHTSFDWKENLVALMNTAVIHTAPLKNTDVPTDVRVNRVWLGTQNRF